jgi:hypothetical protein
MRAIALPEGLDGWRGPLASAVLHALVIAVLVAVVPKPTSHDVADIPISVDILPPPMAAARSKPARVPPLIPETGSRSAPSTSGDLEAALPRGPSAMPSAPTEPPPLVRARKLLSQAALADPRSSAARRDLRTMAADERAVQLCGIEAMEQVHAANVAFVPEAVVAYATKSLAIRGGSIVADGAAFYSGGTWYRLRFECDVRSDDVVSFAYSVGEPIPRASWEALSLPERAEDDDG